MEDLRAPRGANKKKVVMGRGYGCRKGGTCGKGTKGQNARAGGGVRIGFEGGQMPLFRRVAQRGFSNYPFKKEYEIVNLDRLEAAFENGETVSAASLAEKRLVSGPKARIKILGRGEISKKLTIDIECVSGSARDKIEKAGGTVKAPQERA